MAGTRSPTVADHPRGGKGREFTWARTEEYDQGEGDDGPWIRLAYRGGDLHPAVAPEHGERIVEIAWTTDAKGVHRFRCPS